MNSENQTLISEISITGRFFAFIYQYIFVKAINALKKYIFNWTGFNSTKFFNNLKPSNLEKHQIIGESILDAQRLSVLQQAIISQGKSKLDELLNTGLVLRKMGRFTDAYSYFLAHIYIDGAEPRAFLGSVRCAFASDRVDELRQYFSTMALVEKDNINYVYGLGNIYYRLGVYPEAVKCLKSVINQDSSHSFAHGSLAKVYIYQGKYYKAIKHLKISYNLASNKGQANAFAYLANNMGYCYYCLGDIDEAIRCYDTARQWALENEQDGQYGLLCLNLGDMYFDAGDIPKAEYMYYSALYYLQSENMLRGTIRVLLRFAILSSTNDNMHLAKKVLTRIKGWAKFLRDSYLLSEIELCQAALALVMNRSTWAARLIDSVKSYNRLIKSRNLANSSGYFASYLDSFKDRMLFASILPDCARDSRVSIAECIATNELFQYDYRDKLVLAKSLKQELLHGHREVQKERLDIWFRFTTMFSNEDIVNDLLNLLQSSSQPNTSMSENDVFLSDSANHKNRTNRIFRDQSIYASAEAHAKINK